MKPKLLTVVIETPKGSRNKYAFEEEKHFFILKKALPQGMNFPFDFGFIPATAGEDGDPLDLLLLHDEPTFPGCRVEAKLIGVIEGEQVDAKGKKERNDRFVGVSSLSSQFRTLIKIKDLPQHLLEEIEHFLVSYHDLEDEKFRILTCASPKEAWKQVEKGLRTKASTSIRK